MSKSQPDIEDLQKKIGFNFKNTHLVKNAFIHRSYLNENKNYRGQSNERLEFLGDSVLSLVVSRFLYIQNTKMDEGQLTTIRASLVRTETLAKIAHNLSLGNYLLLSKGEEDSGGRDNTSILANTFEALIGAIYLDLGIEKTEKFLKKIVLDKWKTISESAIEDYKSKLQEVLQKRHHESPTYRLISTWGPDHERQFEMGVYFKSKILGKGVGKNKQQAAQNAAKTVLGNLTTG